MKDFVTRAQFNRALSMIETISAHQSRLFLLQHNLAVMNRALTAAVEALRRGDDPTAAFVAVRDEFRLQRPADFEPEAWGLPPRSGG